MSKDYLSFLSDLIEHSKLPSIIINDDNIIENNRFKELSIHPTLKKALILKYTVNSSGYEDINGDYYGVNVVRYATFTLIEFYPKSPVDKLKKDPEVINYLNCFFAKLRSEVYGIARKTDALQQIFEEYLEDYENASVTLSNIYDDLNNIMSTILNPEQIVCLTSDNCNEDNINLTRVISDLARDFLICHPETEVSITADDIFMTKINRYGFEVIISNFLERVYKGKYKPDGIDFIINQVDEIITVQIKADFSSKTPSDNNFSNDKEYADDFFFQYVLEIFCSKFNAKSSMVNNTFFEISFPATPFYKLDLHASARFIPDPDRFAPVVVKTRKKYM